MLYGSVRNIRNVRFNFEEILDSSKMIKSKLWLFVSLGAAFWFNVAVIIRFFGRTVFLQGNPILILFFVLAIPLIVLSMYITTLTVKSCLANCLNH